MGDWCTHSTASGQVAIQLSLRIGRRMLWQAIGSAAKMRSESEPMKMKYGIVLHPESDGGCFATVPALPGCVSQGDNQAEALANIREAIELYIADCKEAGDPIPLDPGGDIDPRAA
jgi:predicted RNase H-like HicB family nuclease